MFMYLTYMRIWDKYIVLNLRTNLSGKQRLLFFFYYI